MVRTLCKVCGNEDTLEYGAADLKEFEVEHECPNCGLLEGRCSACVQKWHEMMYQLGRKV